MTILVELSLLPSIANRRAATIYIPFQAKMLFTLRRTGPRPFQSIDSTGHKARVVQDDSRSTRDDGARSADERRHEVVRGWWNRGIVRGIVERTRGRRTQNKMNTDRMWSLMFP